VFSDPLEGARSYVGTGLEAPVGGPAKRLRERGAGNARRKKWVVKAVPISGCDLNSAIHHLGSRS